MSTPQGKEALAEQLKTKRSWFPSFTIKNPFKRTPAQEAKRAKERMQKLANKDKATLGKIKADTLKEINANESLHKKFEKYVENIDYKVNESGELEPLLTENETDVKPSVFSNRNEKTAEQTKYANFMIKKEIINGENIWRRNVELYNAAVEKINTIDPSTTKPTEVPVKAPAASAPAGSATPNSATASNADDPSTAEASPISQAPISNGSNNSRILARLVEQGKQLANIEARLAKSDINIGAIAKQAAEAVKTVVASQMPGSPSGASKIDEAAALAENEKVAAAAARAASKAVKGALAANATNAAKPAATAKANAATSTAAPAATANAAANVATTTATPANNTQVGKGRRTRKVKRKSKGKKSRSMRRR